MAEALQKYKIITALHKYYTVEQLQGFLSQNKIDARYCWVTIGMQNEDTEIKKITRINKEEKQINVVIDVANGHIEKFVKFCARVRNSVPNAIICAGNVVNPAMVQELIIHGGVDIVKLQIGPGAACKTRQVTGVGYPTLSCVDECSGVAHGLKQSERRLGLVCSDGGMKTSGDICKAFAAGADFIMVGSLFAGTDECDDAEWVYEYQLLNINKQLAWYTKDQLYPDVDLSKEDKRKKYMKYYGMSSHYAQDKHGDGQKSYRASEGEVLKIPYKGTIADVIKEITGGIRSCCSYIGANSVKDMSKCAVFVKANKLK
jgi:GMP reductase